MKRRLKFLWTLALSLLLAGCGSGGDGKRIVEGYEFALSIDGPDAVSNADPQYRHWLDAEGRWFLEGNGFLPPNTACYSGQCRDANGLMSSAELGPYEFVWKNETTGETGGVSNLSWFCWCSSAPRWSAYVPVVAGANRITVTQRAGAWVQQDQVLVTRQ